MLLDVAGHLVLVGLKVVGQRRSPRRGLAMRKILGKKLFWLYELITYLLQFNFCSENITILSKTAVFRCPRSSSSVRSG